MRNSAKAIIKRDDHILVIKKEMHKGLIIFFPAVGKRSLKLLKKPFEENV